MIEKAFMADVKHFDESEWIFEKCSDYIRSRDTRIFMTSTEIFNWHSSWTSASNLMKISENEYRLVANTHTWRLVESVGADCENHVLFFVLSIIIINFYIFLWYAQALVGKPNSSYDTGELINF